MALCWCNHPRAAHITYPRGTLCWACGTVHEYSATETQREEEGLAMTADEQVKLINIVNAIGRLDPAFKNGAELAAYTSEMTKLASLAGGELVVKGASA